MKPAANRKFLLRVMLGAVLGAAVLISDARTIARADDDDEEPFDTKIIRQILRTIGLRRGDEGQLEYRERSPLVVPPSRNLVPPKTSKATEKNPAWPNDPDVKRRKEAKVKSRDRRSIDWDADTRPLMPNAMGGSGQSGNSQGAGNNQGSGSQGQPTPNNADLSGVLRPSELGYKGGLFSGLFGGPKEEYMTFTGETPRSSLIEPPAGYRTPSPNQPYGVGQEKWVPKPIDKHEAVR